MVFLVLRFLVLFLVLRFWFFLFCVFLFCFSFCVFGFSCFAFSCFVSRFAFLVFHGAAVTTTEALERSPQDLKGSQAEKAYKDMQRKGCEMCSMLRAQKNRSRAERRKRQKQGDAAQKSKVPWHHSLSSVFKFNLFLF